MLARTIFFLIATLTFIAPVSAQDRGRSKAVKDGVSCNEFAQPLKQLFGQSVGVEQCLIISEETVFNIKGQKISPGRDPFERRGRGLGVARKGLTVDLFHRRS